MYGAYVVCTRNFQQKKIYTCFFMILTERTFDHYSDFLICSVLYLSIQSSKYMSSITLEDIIFKFKIKQGYEIIIKKKRAIVLLFKAKQKGENKME